MALAVLIIDDDAAIQETLGEFLSECGFEVVTARDGADALAVLERTTPRPDVILLDLVMPVMDGYQFRQRQLADPSLMSIPVLIVTGHGDARVSDLGAPVLAKPFDADAIAKQLRELAARAKPANDDDAPG
jgi:CheY-like chemotaxis protein